MPGCPSLNEGVPCTILMHEMGVIKLVQQYCRQAVLCCRVPSYQSVNCVCAAFCLLYFFPRQELLYIVTNTTEAFFHHFRKILCISEPIDNLWITKKRHL